MSLLDSGNIDSLINKVMNLFKSKQKFVQPQEVLHTLTKSPALEPTNLLFQAPIKGSFYNSGNYSPNAATDSRHQHGHQGVDLRASGGTDVYPIAEGVVTSVGSGGKGGYSVSIMHPNEVKTYYAHLGTVSVHKGDKVTKDISIGTVGDSGNAKGTFPHVHFQVWQGGQLQNPGKYFSVPKYTNPNPTEREWLSDSDKKQSEMFNMQKHLNQRKAAFSNDLDVLIKVAEQFNKLASKSL